MTTYLHTENERYTSIITDSPDKFYFEHQDVAAIPQFQNGIFENRININPIGIPAYINVQDNIGAAKVINNNLKIIENAAAEFGINPNLLKAVIYTEEARGGTYGSIAESFNLSSSILPANLNQKWEVLIPGSSVYRLDDNIRLSAKLLSEISKRLDNPYPEDVYSLYNGLSNDRTYQNAQLKDTPYFMKQAMLAEAWKYPNWHLGDQSNTAQLQFFDTSNYGIIGHANTGGVSYVVRDSIPFANIAELMGWTNPDGSVNLSGFLASNSNNDYLVNRSIGTNYYLFGENDVIAFGVGLPQDFSFGITGLTEDKFTGLVHQNVSNPSGSWLDTSEFDAVIGRIETLKYTDYQNQTTKYDVYNINAKDTIEKLGGSVWVNDVTPVHSDGQDYSLVKDGASTNINGSNYFISNVMDSLDNVASATAQFINDQAGNYLNNTFDEYNINAGITAFFSKYGQALASGNLSAGDAAKYFVLEIAEAGLDDTVTNALLSPSMIALRDGLRNGASSAQLAVLAQQAQMGDSLSKVLDKIGFTNASNLSLQLQESFVKMALEFALHSNGWNAEQYVKAGSAIVTGIVVTDFVNKTWGDSFGAAGSAEAEQKLLNHAAPLIPEEWASGDIIYIMEFIAPFGHAQKISKDMKQHLAGRKAHAIRSDNKGGKVVTTFYGDV